MWLKRCDAAEHRHRRRGRRLPADDRLGRGDRRRQRSSRRCCSLIIFMWTPPHFWALALFMQRRLRARRRADAAGGRRRASDTRCQILLYTLLLAPLGVAALAARLRRRRSMASTALVLGAVLAGAARWRSAAHRTRGRARCAPPRKLFAFSILYLFAAVRRRCWSSAARCAVGWHERMAP